MQTLTPKERIVLDKVLNIQLNSLEYLLETMQERGMDVYDDIHIEYTSEDKTPQKFEETYEEIFKRRNEYWELKKKPENVWSMESEKIGMLKHIIFNYGERWEDTYPEAVKSLWFKLVNISMVQQNLGLN